MNITDLCLRRPVFAWMLMCGTILFGILAVMRIGVSQFPDVDNPTVSVGITWPGASPEDVETGIVNPIEDAMSQVSGVLTLSSSAKTGSARITATFDLSRNIDLALQDTQAKIAQVQRSLPVSSQAPVVSKSNPDDQPIMTVGISGPFSRQLLADVARYQVQDMLQTVPGVGQIQTMGYLDRNIRVWVDAEKLVATGTTVSDVVSAIQKQHVSMPGGQMNTGGLAFDVRVVGEVPDLATMRNIVVRNTGITPVRLQDVALVEDGFQDVTSYARSNGATVQAMGILKQPGSNAVSVAKSVRAALDKVQATLPPGMKVEVIFDTTGFIQESVNEIGLELGLAVILTGLVCWVFLGSLSSTMNVLFAIPMSLLGTIAILYFAGFTLNTFTLLGLSLAVGLVVDDAVMVMENIFRHAEMGKDRVRAAGEGTKEITFAALAATIAVIAIFMPVAFMSGVVGKFFLQFGVTLSVAVAISYVEAITLAPARCAQMLRTSHEARGIVGRLADRGFSALARGYGRTLDRSLRRPWLVLGAAVAVLAVAGYAVTRIQQEFVPSQDQSRLSVKLSAVVGANLAETDALVRQAEKYLQGQPEVVDVMTNVSANGGNLQVTLVPPNQRNKTQSDLSTVWRKQLNGYPGLRASVQDLSQQGFAGQRGWPVEFSVRGSDWGTLVGLSKKLKSEAAASGLIVDIESDYALGAPELVITPDRGRATDVGVSVQDIATTVSSLVGGVVVGQYSNAGRRMDIRLRLTASQRTRPEDLSPLRVRTSTGTQVPLSSVVRTTEQPELQEINHADRERAITITGNVAPGHSQGEALAFVQSLVSSVPPGYRVVLGGQSSQFGDAMTSLLFALLVGILVAYMVLASQFNSLLHPITVLTILPLSVAGAIFALLIAGKTLNVFSMIGLLLLMGIVKKNSIILVDYATELRNHEGLDAHTAMLRAGPVRLRPILMTAVATLMAAVPSSLGLGPGSETRGPMADAVIGGLVLSTALSLLVVPAFYVVADRLRSRKGLLAGAAPAALVALALSFSLGCSRGDSTAGTSVRPPPLVVVGKIAVRDVPVEVRAPVDLRPLEQADVGSKTLGVLDAVLVDRGDHVKRGQLLALVRPSDLPDQLAAARGMLAQTQASLSLSQTNYERARALAPSGVVSQQELQSSSAALATALAAQTGAQAQVSALAVRLGELRIDSPVDGVVAARRLDPGAMVGLLSGATIVTIARIDVLRVLISVTEKDIPSVHVGQDAHVELDGAPGKSYRGKVVRMAPEIDPSTRTLDAVVNLRNDREELRSGMFGHGSIVVDVHPHAVVVPAQALQVSNGKAYVYLLQGDRVQRRSVETGVDGGTWLEVVQGVAEGDEVVSAGMDVLSDGALVRVVRDVDPYTGANLEPMAPSAKPD